MTLKTIDTPIEPRAVRRGLSRTIITGLVFVPCYVAFDWASYFYPLGPFYITPWNPQPALAVVLVMLLGFSNILTVAIAIFLADVIVRDAPGGYAVSVLIAMLLALGYAGIGQLLRRFVKEAGLQRLRELALFCVIIAAGTALIGLAYVGFLGLLEQPTGMTFSRAWLRFWIGDFVGIFVTAPLLLIAADAGQRRTLARMARTPEAWLQYAVLGGMLWLIFALYREDAARLFYLLFIPLIWIALRWGMPGAVLAATIAQAGVLVGMKGGPTVIPILELQALVAAFTLMGLFLGVMSDERRASEEKLRQSLRLAAAGEMAGAIAHEVNQPLTALALYSESVKMLLKRGLDQQGMEAILAKMVLEIQRTAEVMRRLRDLFDSGTTRLEPVKVADLLQSSRRIGESVIGNSAISLAVESAQGLPDLYIDRVQVELLLRNLLANSVESIVASGRSDGRIRVSAQGMTAGMILISVADNGPGIPGPTRTRLFQPFSSGKPVGMGLGLAVSRAIAEAHGGTLEAVSNDFTEFHLRLPCIPSR